jgi:hypothetical protein
MFAISCIIAVYGLCHFTYDEKSAHGERKVSIPGGAMFKVKGKGRRRAEDKEKRRKRRKKRAVLPLWLPRPTVLARIPICV